MRTMIIFIAILTLNSLTAGAQYKYVGIKICKACHQTEKQGKQFDIWKKSKHVRAFEALTSDTANAIAKARDLKKPAAESPECLECHTITADKKLLADGVQCESCHGAGSAYKTMAIMKDRAKSIAAGLTEYKDEKAIEKSCRTCHNEKSPTYKEFRFKEMWSKIKHPVPKGK